MAKIFIKVYTSTLAPKTKNRHPALIEKIVLNISVESKDDNNKEKRKETESKLSQGCLYNFCV